MVARAMTKSPLAVARQAMEVAKEALPPYSSRFSRRDFTQHQHFAILTLRDVLRLDLRGIEALLRDWSDLREALGLRKVPDHTTLWHAEQRLLKKGATLPFSRPSSPRPDAPA